MSHTKEPWPVFTEVATTMTPDPEGTPVAIISWDDYIRARACVNACTGIPTNILELDQAELIITLRHHEQVIKQLMQQRDRLSDLADTWNSECDDYRAENSDLANQLAEALKQCDELAMIIATDTGMASATAEAERQRDELLETIEKQIEDNLHLADGENCTLITIKRALAKVKGGA